MEGECRVSRLGVAAQRQHAAWLSMIPVEGDSSAASQFSAGSSARASLHNVHVVDAVGGGMGPIDCSFRSRGCGRDDQRRNL